VSESLTISAKTLGAVDMPDFCPRCFWLEMHAEGFPYQIFPGIFSSIDSYGKRLVHGWFDRHQSAPPWLRELGDLQSYRNPPHFSKFRLEDRETNIVLRGTPDGILVRRDESYVIVDYKTARFTAHQDELFPMYDTQLNAYAFIAEPYGFSPVSGLALVYTEPVTDNAAVAKEANLTQAGFVMEFWAHIVPVDLKPKKIPALLRKVREIYDLKRPPKSRAGCANCALMKNLIEVAAQ
jgi:PD-(D/E)XK nuclease superfamily